MIENLCIVHAGLFHVAGGVALGYAVGAPHEAHLAKDVPSEGHVARRVHQLASDGYELRDWKAVVYDSAL